ncbi:putative tellurite resistance protein B-like protein [Litoreibacter ponti]|uniref:Putative tellurite resistance protein B-like protein n=1 Tax=Litoreibacter ponti TaxID=1510457 RepID=A0A2T6BK52_9RHOB|nr:TerB family tellurite resistance protein [Litoreibacter ponti]PTX56438.1 putative tellurite resistance protein B-like protein [Litoreibacter ponti]
MLNDFLNRLAGKPETPKTAEDERLALTALLVRIARSNWDYATTEVDTIDRILERRYGLDANAAADLRHDAEAVEAQANDTVQFTRAIKDNVEFEDREQVIEAMWELVLADGVRDAEEEGILRLIAPLLGVNDRDSALARQRVEARLKS